MKKSSLFALLLATVIVAGSAFNQKPLLPPVTGKDLNGDPHPYPDSERRCQEAERHCLYDINGQPVDKDGQPSDELDGAYELIPPAK